MVNDVKMSKMVHLSYPPENLEDVWRFYRLKKVAEILSNNCSGLLLDIGCNDCSLTHFLPKSRFNYIGADLSRQALLKERHHQRILSDACNLPFRNHSIDVLSCFEIIEHVEDPQQLMKEIARVLKPKGNLLISTPNQKSFFIKLQDTAHLPQFHNWKYVETHFQTFNPQKLDSLLNNYGFKIIKKFRSIAFPPFKITKNRNTFKIFWKFSQLIPEDSQELLIRLAVKVK